MNDKGDFDFRHFSGPVSILLENRNTAEANLHPSDSNKNSFLQLFSGMSIEDVIGSEFNDWIAANNRDNLIMGLDGDDVINTKRGYDTADGGDGDDSINRAASGLEVGIGVAKSCWVEQVTTSSMVQPVPILSTAVLTMIRSTSTRPRVAMQVLW